jgi:hypothetical protein
MNETGLVVQYSGAIGEARELSDLTLSSFRPDGEVRPELAQDARNNGNRFVRQPPRICAFVWGET